MKQTLKKFWLLFFLIGIGCAQTTKGPPAQTAVLPGEIVESPKQTEVPSEETVGLPEQTAEPFDETVGLPEQTAEPFDETVAPSKRTVAPPKKTVAPPKQTVAPSKKTVAPPKKTVAPPKKTVAPSKKTKSQKFKSMRPEERHVWLPPSQKELEARRQRQKRLDVVAADLERLFMGYADILGDEIILENLLRGKESELQQLEARAGRQSTKEEKRVEKLKKVLQEIEGSIQEMDSSLDEIQKERAVEKTQPKSQPKSWTDDYRHAILLFRDGQYRKSIAKFKSLLSKKYPRSLKDNILFGLASNYYKLKKYDKALVNLNTVIRDHPKGDKWLVSHAISGMIYNLQGKPGKAIPVLESALQHNPNPELLKMISRLLNLAKEGVRDASS